MSSKFNETTPTSIANTGNDSIVSEKVDAEIEKRIESLKTQAGLIYEYNLTDNTCFRAAVNRKYLQYQNDEESPTITEKINNFIDPVKEITSIYTAAAGIVYYRDPEYVKNSLANCLNRKKATPTNGNSAKNTEEKEKITYKGGPFDRRMDRLMISNNDTEIRRPYSTIVDEKNQDSLYSLDGFIINEESINNSNVSDKQSLIEQTKRERDKLKNDPFFRGAPSLINTYAITTLYGSDGGERLINQRDKRRWYEIDQAIGDDGQLLYNYASVPTTSSIVAWGNADPYGRTPYHFNDFVFCKYWNRIENNRLITLRKYAAPILGNLKFPGMDGSTISGSSGDDKGNGGASGGGSNSKVSFPPIATALTYFGGDSNNKLSDLIKFTTGLNWDTATADVWSVTGNTEPGHDSGFDSGDGKGFKNAYGIFGHLGSLSKTLSITSGDFDTQQIMNNGALPPDPYNQGPYENRILGPVNRIDSTYKRKAGLQFGWDGLTIEFEYVGRPVGGINTKAAILDILSNFLVIGSAEAVFFGGQHRFMAQPSKYPFLGGDKGIESWYNGKPVQFANNTISNFAQQGKDTASALGESFKKGFDALFSGGGNVLGKLTGLFTGEGGTGNGPGGGIVSNVVKHAMAAKTTGGVSYLEGFKAILTGQPVGNWHVTIGNPLNPIAMIGNLICDKIEVDWSEELGPDDFPTEIKIKAHMKHAMALDKSGIESIFNRGMGRIYSLPENLNVSSDTTSEVDKYTGGKNASGSPVKSQGTGTLVTGARSGTNVGPAFVQPPQNQGEVSVWNHTSFKAAGNTSNLYNEDGDLRRSQYRSVEWIAKMGLK